MLNVTHSLWTRRAFVLALPVIAGLSANEAKACAVTSFTYDPTAHEVYFQFSTDCEIDAWKVTVKEIGAPLRKRTGGHPHGTTGVSGEITGLPCGTQFRFRLLIRCDHGGPWVVARQFTFWTNACP